MSPDPASAPLVANGPALGEPSTQGGTSSGSPVCALPLGTEGRRLSTRPLASAKGDAGTAKPSSKRLRPAPLDAEPPRRSGGCTMNGGEPPVPCLLSSDSACTQTAKACQYIRCYCTASRECMNNSVVQSYRNGKGGVAGGEPLSPGCLLSSRLWLCLPQTM